MSGPILFDPADEAAVTFDWTDVLGDTLTISGSVEHTVPSPLVRESQSTNSADNLSQVIISGASHGIVYYVSAKATLSNGEIIEKTWPIRGWNA